MYDVVIIGAGPGGIYSAYELIKLNKGLKIVVLEEGNPLEKRKCPIDGKKVKWTSAKRAGRCCRIGISHDLTATGLAHHTIS